MAERTLVRRIFAIFDRASAQKSEQEFKESLAKAGSEGGKAFLRELRSAFDKRMAELKTALAAGLIDPKEFKKQSDLAAKAFNDSLLKSMEKARLEGNLTEKEYLKLSRTLKRTGDEGATAWARIKNGIIGAGGALVAFFSLRQIGRMVSDLIRLGVAAEETASKFRTTFGPATAQMDEFIKTFGRLAGLSRDEARDFSATIAAMARGMGFTISEAAELSRQVLVLAGDLTSFNNVPIADTLRAIRSAIVGEREPLKTLGIVIKETDVQQRAMAESGKANAAALTQQEKAAATLLLIQERMGPSAGDLVRTQDSLANQSRSVAAAWRDMKGRFGELLTSWDGGTPTLKNLGNLLRGIRDHAEEILSVVASLTKALLVAGLVFGVTRLAVALRTATVAAEGFLAVWRASLVMLGPKGWLILGVTALTGVFEAMSAKARTAAREAKDALDQFKSTLVTATEVELKAKEAELAARRGSVQQRLSALKAIPRFSGQASESLGMRTAIEADRKRQQEIRTLETELNQIREKGNAILEARKSIIVETPPTVTPIDKGREKELAKELEKVLADTAVARLQIEKGLTEGQAREQVRREQLLAGHVERTKASVAELTAAYAELARAQGIVGVLAPTATQRTGELGRPTESTAPGLLPIPAGGLPEPPDQKAPAKEFFDPWFEAMHLLRDEVEGEGSLFAELGQAWAEGGLAGFARLAAAKVKENIARAIEEAAKAFGSFALGNPAAATAHAKAAAGHAAAATAWKVAGGAAGGGGSAGNGGGIAAGAGPGSDRASRIDTRAEVHVHIPERVASLVDDKDFQSMVYVGQERFRERVGNNVKVIVHRGSR